MSDGISCQQCAEGFTTNTEGALSCDSCVERYFLFMKDEQAQCRLCGKDGGFTGSECNTAGTSLATISLERGYWRTSASSDDIRRCPYAEYCIGGTGYKTEIDSTRRQLTEEVFNSDNYCRANHQGPYCRVCDADSFPSVIGKCNKCVTADVETWLTLAGILVGILLIGAGCYALKPQKKLSKNAKQRVKNIGKILFVFLQILCVVPDVFGVLLPSPFADLIQGLAIPSLNIPLAAVLGCLYSSDYYLSVFVTSMIVPLSLMFLVGLYYAWGLWRAKKNGNEEPEEAKRRKNLCFGAGLIVLYVFLPMASRILFGCFQCDEFDDGSTALNADLSLSCDTAQYQGMALYAVLMLCVWPLGVPILFTVILVSHREQLTCSHFVLIEEKEEDGGDGDDASDEAKAAKQRRKSVRWQQAEDLGTSALDAVAKEEQQRLAHRDDDTTLDGFRILFDTYRTSAWYWELVVTIRRLMMTGVLVALERGSITQYSCGLLVSLFSALLQAAFRPYCEQPENWLALMAEINTYLVIFLACLASLKDSLFEGPSGTGIGILLTILTVAVIVFSIALLNLALFYKGKRSTTKILKKQLGQKRSDSSDEEEDNGVEMKTRRAPKPKPSRQPENENLNPVTSDIFVEEDDIEMHKMAQEADLPSRNLDVPEEQSQTTSPAASSSLLSKVWGASPSSSSAEDAWNKRPVGTMTAATTTTTTSDAAASSSSSGSGGGGGGADTQDSFSNHDQRKSDHHLRGAKIFKPVSFMSSRASTRSSETSKKSSMLSDADVQEGLTSVFRSSTSGSLAANQQQSNPMVTSARDATSSATTTEDGGAAEEQESSVASAHDNGSSAAAVTSAQEQWNPVEDPATGKTYYHNKETGVTSWTNPNRNDETDGIVQGLDSSAFAL